MLQGQPQPDLEESIAISLTKDRGSMRGQPPNIQPGDTTLRIHIQKWGFKDATLFSQPRVVVSVRNEQGDVLEAVQVGASPAVLLSVPLVRAGLLCNSVVGCQKMIKGRPLVL